MKMNDESVKPQNRPRLHCDVYTHRLSTVKRADQIVMMHQGEVVEYGTHTIDGSKGRYYALYRQQESE